ncbi:Hypothetical_protein [Hexamita inflata]|uniref:Hypothetical_protein n=1 Tax=Hexamita inflata TaxID=28002 RepID=A0AA86P6E6_9EUKA|nr:Hypothetical protein HINF_LOCUS18954 [Hexamita inflata]
MGLIIFYKSTETLQAKDMNRSQSKKESYRIKFISLKTNLSQKFNSLQAKIKCLNQLRKTYKPNRLKTKYNLFNFLFNGQQTRSTSQKRENNLAQGITFSNSKLFTYLKIQMNGKTVQKYLSR